MAAFRGAALGGTPRGGIVTAPLGCHRRLVQRPVTPGHATRPRRATAAPLPRPRPPRRPARERDRRAGASAPFREVGARRGRAGPPRGRRRPGGRGMAVTSALVAAVTRGHVSPDLAAALARLFPAPVALRCAPPPALARRDPGPGCHPAGMEAWHETGKGGWASARLGICCMGEASELSPTFFSSQPGATLRVSRYVARGFRGMNPALGLAGWWSASGMACWWRPAACYARARSSSPQWTAEPPWPPSAAPSARPSSAAWTTAQRTRLMRYATSASARSWRGSRACPSWARAGRSGPLARCCWAWRSWSRRCGGPAVQSCRGNRTA